MSTVFRTLDGLEAISTDNTLVNGLESPSKIWRRYCRPPSIAPMTLEKMDSPDMYRAPLVRTYEYTGKWYIQGDNHMPIYQEKETR